MGAAHSLARNVGTCVPNYIGVTWGVGKRGKMPFVYVLYLRIVFLLRILRGVNKKLGEWRKGAYVY
jgi:hypothetical protein